MDHTIRPTTSAASSTAFVDVLVPVALDQTYSYRVPRGMALVPGDLVAVPLGPREVLAVVWADNATPDPRLHNRLKDVGEKLDVPPLQRELRALVDWVANYTLSPRGMVLRMCLKMGEQLGPERTRIGVRLVGEPPKRLTPARRRLIEVLSDRLLHNKSEAAKEAGVSTSVVDGLVDEGTLTVEPMPRPPPPPPPDPSHAQPEFSRQQRAPVDAMRALAANGSFHVALLDGVTGSGKTVADPDAGNRADRAVSGPFCAAVWRAADRMAFGANAAHARAQFCCDHRRRGAGRSRRALGAVSALCRSRPHRGR
jgi:primosomal protein N' (replication factor Y)